MNGNNEKLLQNKQRTSLPRGLFGHSVNNNRFSQFDYKLNGLNPQEPVHVGKGRPFRLV